MRPPCTYADRGKSSNVNETYAQPLFNGSVWRANLRTNARRHVFWTRVRNPHILLPVSLLIEGDLHDGLVRYLAVVGESQIRRAVFSAHIREAYLLEYCSTRFVLRCLSVVREKVTSSIVTVFLQQPREESVLNTLRLNATTKHQVEEPRFTTINYRKTNHSVRAEAIAASNHIRFEHGVIYDSLELFERIAVAREIHLIGPLGQLVDSLHVRIAQVGEVHLHLILPEECKIVSLVARQESFPLLLLAVHETTAATFFCDG